MNPAPPAPDASASARRHLRDALLLALTFATGAVDVVSYLGLGGVFTANMTGNTIFLAIAIGQGNALTAVRSIVALVGFSGGAFVAGRRLEGGASASPWPTSVTTVLWGEAVFMTAFAAVWWVVGGRPSETVTLGLITLSSVGMGLQSAAGRKLAVPSTTTNVLTMALTGLMAELAALGISGPDAKRWAGVILAMGTGAALGAAIFVIDRAWLPLLPLGVLLAVCIIAPRGTERKVSSALS